MNDRFKFRCGITISHYDDDGNDIETLLLVNNVVIYDDGEVGFDGYSLEDALDRANLSSEKRRTLFNSLEEYEVFEDWYQMPADFIEQCTGLKDKNGKLIYENDLVRAFGFTESYILVCRFRRSSFCLEHVDGRPYNFVHSVAPIEVIGNIHTDKKLLDFS